MGNVTKTMQECSSVCSVAPESSFQELFIPIQPYGESLPTCSLENEQWGRHAPCIANDIQTDELTSYDSVTDQKYDTPDVWIPDASAIMGSFSLPHNESSPHPADDSRFMLNVNSLSDGKILRSIDVVGFDPNANPKFTAFLDAYIEYLLKQNHTTPLHNEFVLSIIHNMNSPR